MAFPYVTPHCRQSVAPSSKSPDFIELDLGLWNRSEVCCSQYLRQNMRQKSQTAEDAKFRKLLENLLSSNLLRIYAHLFRAPLPCPSPSPSLGVFSLSTTDRLTVRCLLYFPRHFSHFSLPINHLHSEGIEPPTFYFLSLIVDSVACGTVQWLPLM